MAIDTEDRRRAVVSTVLPWLLVPPVPGTITDADRPHVANVYRGLTFEEAVAAVRSMIALRLWWLRRF